MSKIFDLADELIERIEISSDELSPKDIYSLASSLQILSKLRGIDRVEDAIAILEFNGLLSPEESEDIRFRSLARSRFF